MVGFRHKMLMGVDRIPFGYSGFLLSLKYPHKERIDSLISTFHELGIYQVWLLFNYCWHLSMCGQSLLPAPTVKVRVDDGLAGKDPREDILGCSKER